MNDLLCSIVGSALQLVGVPANIACVAANAIPRVVDWVRVALEQGRDPAAELEAMLDTADLVADAAEAAKFRGKK